MEERSLGYHASFQPFKTRGIPFPNAETAELGERIGEPRNFSKLGKLKNWAKLMSPPYDTTT